jgi:NADH-quinone oxidoreductase subunit M
MLPIAFSAVTLVLASLMLLGFDFNNAGVNNYQYTEQYEWVPSLGITYHLGVDGISVPMVWLTTLLCFLAILFSWDVKNRTGSAWA